MVLYFGFFSKDRDPGNLAILLTLIYLSRVRRYLTLVWESFRVKITYKHIRWITVIRSALTQFCLALFYIQTQVLESLFIVPSGSSVSLLPQGLECSSRLPLAVKPKAPSDPHISLCTWSGSAAGHRAHLNTGYPCPLAFLAKRLAYMQLICISVAPALGREEWSPPVFVFFRVMLLLRTYITIWNKSAIGIE